MRVSSTPLFFLAFIGAVAAAAGCGSAPPSGVQPSTPPAPTAQMPASAITPPGPGQWDTWPEERKVAWMKAAVLPAMGQRFHAFDAARFGSPTCVMCHGAGAAKGHFDMPNADLPRLPTDPVELERLTQREPKMVAFMREVVQPTMASLVGEEPFDAQSGHGFGCFECHTKK